MRLYYIDIDMDIDRYYPVHTLLSTYMACTLKQLVNGVEMLIHTLGIDLT